MGKVLMLASIAPMIEAFNQKHIQTLQSIGHDVHVAANFTDEAPKAHQRNQQFKKQLSKQNIPVYELPISRNPFSKDNFAAYRRIKQLLEKEQYDMIHCHSPIGGVLTRLAAGQSRKKGTAVLYTAHGFHFFKGAPRKNWLLYYPIEKLLSKRTDCLITINTEDYTHALEKNFSMQTMKLVNGVGIDLNKFSPTSDEKRKTLRKQYGYNNDDFLLIYVGELISRKNQQHALNIAHHLSANMPQIKLLLAGDGEDEIALAERIQKLKLQNKVELLGFRTDITELMSLSDIAISTSKQEGLPVNVMEAMGVGLSLVVTDCRGNRDLVNNGLNGYVVQQDNVKAFSEKIEVLAQHKPLRDKFSQYSTLFIRQYGDQEVQKEMKQIYTQFTLTKQVEPEAGHSFSSSKINSG